MTLQAVSGQQAQTIDLEVCGAKAFIIAALDELAQAGQALLIVDDTHQVILSVEPSDTSPA